MRRQDKQEWEFWMRDRMMHERRKKQVISILEWIAILFFLAVMSTYGVLREIQIWSD